MSGGPVEDVAALRAFLVASRIAGEVDTPREINLRNAGLMAQAQEGYAFGLVPRRRRTTAEVVAVMVERCGIDPDPAHRNGIDTIDPDLTIAQLERWRVRLGEAAARHERVLLATGHPTGVMAIHLQVATALRTAGAEVLVPTLDWVWEWDEPSPRPRPRTVLAMNGVHVLGCGGELLHTHAAEPMRAVLAALREQGSAPPDLVVADHGWAGVAAEAGLETLGLADSNDPALFVAEHEGKPIVTVPLDDNVPPHLYEPLSAYVTRWA